jgi:hypothetical protein
MANLHNSLRFFERLKSKLTSLPTRLMLFDRLKLKKVVFICANEFREAIETSILELFGVERVDLTPQEQLELDKEVALWYKNVPTWWSSSKVGRNKRSFLRIHRDFLSKTINLNPVSFLSTQSHYI